MTNISYKYILENSHTFMRITEDGQKQKVKTGEIIQLDEKILDRGRMFLAWFRVVLEDGSTESYGNDVSIEENEKIAKDEEKTRKKAEKAEKNLVESTVEVPEIIVPLSDTQVDVVVTALEDGKDEITIKAA